MGSKSIRNAFRSHKRAFRRMAFTHRYESNPANYLPGSVLTMIYRQARSQKEVETMAAKWMARNEEWVSRRVQHDAAMWRASARWPS